MGYRANTYVTTLFIASLIVTPDAASASYDDVAVVVNTNSDVSLAIGAYFKSARALPDVNVIFVNVPTGEEIDGQTFESLRDQVESHLCNHNLQDVINYIVTTKGLPLKVNRGDSYSTLSPSSSVESELTLILGPNAQFIGSPGRVISPYYGRAEHFSRSSHGIYLVTRLDGYSVQDVQSLIDRSGPGVITRATSTFVLDKDPAWDAANPSLNSNLETARACLSEKGKSVLLNTDSVYVTDQLDVIGYISWGSNDHFASSYTDHAIPHNSWAPGALVETYVSTSARSFENPPDYGQSLIADWIQEGASGAKGYVYEPFSSSMAVAYVLFDRYVSGFNLAESYYMASFYLSWMDVIVGDPKTSLGLAGDPSLPIQMDFFNAAYSETSRGTRLTWRTISETNNFGFAVQARDSSAREFTSLPRAFVPGHGTTMNAEEYSWIDTVSGPGTYYYRLCQIDLDGTQHYSESRLVKVRQSPAWQTERLPDRFALEQNYPNPFNPSTMIGFTTTRPGRVTIAVYTDLGQLVAILMDRDEPAGPHRVRFSPVDFGLASGTYYYRMQTQQTVCTRRMIYLK